MLEQEASGASGSGALAIKVEIISGATCPADGGRTAGAYCPIAAGITDAWSH